MTILKEEYGIEMTETLKGRINKMCNYSQGVLQRGYDSGYGTGYDNGYGSGYDNGYDSGDDAVSKLFSILVTHNRMDDLKRATVDKEYRRKLIKELLPGE